MADISGYLANIRSAARGEDVRDSIINALQKINADNPAKIKPLNVTANGTYAGQGGIVYNPITVNVPEGESNAISLVDVNITENGEKEADEGTAFKSVTVEVPQYVNEIMEDPFTITAEGTYSALDEGYDGFSEVVVKIESGGSTKTYTVHFMAADRVTELGSVVGVPHGGGAVYKGPTPTSSGMRFVGWTPNPVYITGETFCYPRFENMTYGEGQIDDDWITIARTVQTNPDAYQIGQWKMLEIAGLAAADCNETTINAIDTVTAKTFNSARIRMQLVAKGVDQLEGQNGYAPTTWIARDVYYIQPSSYIRYKNSNVQNGAYGYTIDYEGFLFLHDQFLKQLFPQDLRQYLKTVIKYSTVYTGSQVLKDYPSRMTLWVPSVRELYGNCSNYDVTSATGYTPTTSGETIGPIYDIFSEEGKTITENAPRIIAMRCDNYELASTFATRTIHGLNWSNVRNYYVGTNGYPQVDMYGYALRLSFCL